MNAALGVVQLQRLEEMNAQRKSLAEHYLQLLDDADEITPLAQPDLMFKHAWHLFIVRLDIESYGISRDDFMAALKERGIGTGLHFCTVHTQKYYQ